MIYKYLCIILVLKYYICILDLKNIFNNFFFIINININTKIVIKFFINMVTF